ncbi:matrixin family metalloprotease [bacterium]|nr:matrixin family metalloprotease [bacterium]
MDAETLKKKLQNKNPLMMSPMAFVLAACGGGSKTQPNVIFFDTPEDELIGLMTNDSKFSYSDDDPITFAISNGHRGEIWMDEDAVEGSLRDVFTKISIFTDAQFEYAGLFDDPTETTDIDVVLSYDAEYLEANDLGFVFSVKRPGNAFNPLADDQSTDGHIYINSNSTTFEYHGFTNFEEAIVTTGLGQQVLMHSVLRALGIRSTYQSFGERPSVEATRFDANAENPLYSVSNRSYSVIEDDLVVNPGVWDILGLMYLYGLNATTNAGDTIYQLSDLSEYTPIYDTSGLDTISFASATENIFAILPSINTTKANLTAAIDVAVGGGYVNEHDGQLTTFAVFGDIENLQTGSGNDTLTGNELSNYINAGDGNDIINITPGADTIFGGAGNDTFNISKNTIDSFSGEVATSTVIKDFELGRDNISFDGYDEVLFTLNENGFAKYTVASDVDIVLENILVDVRLAAPTDVSESLVLSVLDALGQSGWAISSPAYFGKSYDVPDTIENFKIDNSFGQTVNATTSVVGYEQTENELINALLYNDDVQGKWDLPSQTLTYSFHEDSTPGTMLDEYSYNDAASYVIKGVYAASKLPLNEIQRQTVREGLKEFSSVTNLNFVEVDETTEFVGELRFSGTTYDYDNNAGWATVPRLFEISSAGDVWFSENSINDLNWEVGQDQQYSTQQYSTIVHEVGHALGLEHPHEGNLMPLDYDLDKYTVMSYEEQEPSVYHEAITYHSDNIDLEYLDAQTAAGFDHFLYATHLMVYDIAALQHLYGANYDYNSGDTIYTFDERQPFVETIWDGAGIDLIDLANFEVGSTVDLNPGAYSEINYVGWDYGVNLGIAFDCFIENINGTQGFDKISGNNLDNQINGCAGDDIVYGLDGDDIFDWEVGSRGGTDTFYGGLGDDTYVLDTALDLVVEEFNQGIDTVFADFGGSYELTDNVENFISLSEIGNTITDNALDNVIIGSDAPDTIISKSGNDTLMGGEGADIFYVEFGDRKIDVFEFDINEDQVIFMDKSGSEIAMSEITLNTVGVTTELSYAGETLEVLNYEILLA